ncbi:hypothetical protein [Sediminibacillus massiliensis]|uniref:hypothetical protein n=1 Tax=Sediminibacillus massiliensis TaxID=1926277 RepID=UPI0015C32B4D|nr:hypothetical protein [Sediminibacillus massiliensis]
MHNRIIEQNSQADQVKYIMLTLLSLLTVRKINRLESWRKEVKEKIDEEKDFTRL